MLRRLNLLDIDKIVDVHLRSFPGFFLSFLGPRFLKLFYLGLYKANEGIIFVYVNEDNAPIGFVVGAINPSGFYSRLLKRDWLRFACASVIPILKKPLIFGRIARALYYPANNPIGENVAGLFSIGVSPETKRAGIGKLLVKAFLEEAKNRGCKKVYLTTDSDNNEIVNKFYLGIGFTLGRQFEPFKGRRMNEYWIYFSN
jgi:ribosomal protein S18 acetylase RimI-like enzyme